MQRIESANRGAMISLMLAELAEGKGRFIPHLADGAWFAAEQTSWVRENIYDRLSFTIKAFGFYQRNQIVYPFTAKMEPLPT